MNASLGDVRASGCIGALALHWLGAAVEAFQGLREHWFRAWRQATKAT
jgi:hypothetical protein